MSAVTFVIGLLLAMIVVVVVGAMLEHAGDPLTVLLGALVLIMIIAAMGFLAVADIHVEPHARATPAEVTR